jgi:Fe2+ transport system protein FeoA
MVKLGGSEIVALEIAEALYERGFEVHIRTNRLSIEVVRSSLAPVSFSDSDDLIDLCDFDFVWMQHNMVAHLHVDKLLNSHRLPIIVSAHLSPFEMFELAGVGFGLLVGAKLVSNSAETKARLVSMGVEPHHILNIKNAAPKRFESAPPSRRNSLSRLLVVSNHVPDEVLKAVTLLKKRGVVVKIFGSDAIERRVSEFDIRETDAVLTIGKTVQYALLSGIPVFCYDHFGGPGWLTKENFDNASYYNFSGRCCRKRGSAESIFDDLLQGYEQAVEDAFFLKKVFGGEFLLDQYLDNLLNSGRSNFVELNPRKVMINAYLANSWKLRLLYRRVEKLESRHRLYGLLRRFGRVIRNFLA